jgi:hypothetical protein
MAVALEMMATKEYQDTLIGADFKLYLGRTAGSADLSYWEGQIGQGLTDEGLAAQLIASLEYFHRVNG